MRDDLNGRIAFSGEDSERLDRSWPLWTGARQIHGRLPKCVGLKRISFHKKVDPHSSGKTDGPHIEPESITH